MRVRIAPTPIDVALAGPRAGVAASTGPEAPTYSHLDDWVGAFVARLAWFGVPERRDELVMLGRSLYEHYGLLDPYDIARLVWRRRPKERRALRRHAVP